jgi:xylulokinase
MYFLGIDISTTATKALLIDSNGVVLASAVTEYNFETPNPLWCEQHPNLWWGGTKNSIHIVLQKSAISPAQISGIGLTGQMHGLVLLDDKGKVLRPAILWNDQRTQSQCDEIHQRIGREKFIQITGNVALTGFTAPKILWVKENEPEIYANIAHILLPKDYIRFLLTGEYAMDKADASGTVLMNLKERTWSTEILSCLDIPQDWMPTLCEGTQITGMVSPSAALATGLKIGTPVIAGGGDQAAQAIGVGAIKEGIVALTLGTSGVVFATVDYPFIEPQGKLHAFCHSVPDKWHLMGVMLSAAGSLRWYRDNFAPNLSYDALLDPAGKVPAGSDGLLFLPYLTGERTPYPDPLARGGFIGLTVRHNTSHCIRAVLEGVAFGLKDIFELIKNAGLTKIDQVRVSGGGAKSLLWRQTLANIFETELVTVNTSEGAAFGAALLAGVGLGNWRDIYTACESVISVTGSSLPEMEHFEIYRQNYAIYRDLYPTLRDINSRISKQTKPH